MNATWKVPLGAYLLVALRGGSAEGEDAAPAGAFVAGASDAGASGAGAFVVLAYGAAPAS